MNWIRRIMNKLFIDNESFDIDEDDITLSQILLLSQLCAMKPSRLAAFIE